MTEKFAPAVMNLLDEAQQLSGRKIQVELGTKQVGYIRHGQSRQIDNDDGSLTIAVTDTTNVDYTVSHELLHLLLMQRGYPQIRFNLTTGEEMLDRQLWATAIELYNVVSHVVIGAEQQQLGLVDAQVQEQYLAGILAEVPAEEKADRLVVFRTLALLDTLVFYQGATTAFAQKFEQRYPAAYHGAQSLYQVITAKTIDSPFSFRRAVVNLFAAFDPWLASVGLATTNHNQLITLDGVFSERQQRLEVRQVFEILHSELTVREGGGSAYIGLGKNDHQNTFVITAPTDQDKSAAFFKQIYGESVQTFMQQQQIPFMERK
ncbi:hypothetical protein [Loigolactobacillus coryniformis]|uniref:IpaB/EvcA family protein n=1 Tax=Loigolactobacillus coryniformis TaxID=1610 RepID=A0A5B8TJ95_9LACO|nr:hypothetical protein [Loigolactobacillus coryniformis]QEA52174.1 hypothetical protein FGL77_01770 [Loigolactobacillus coryniformis]RRG05573.1 MAG: hypothetical protein DUD28_05550 [Lactobacillus sp.]